MAKLFAVTLQRADGSFRRYTVVADEMLQGANSAHGKAKGKFKQDEGSDPLPDPQSIVTIDTVDIP